MSMMMKLARHIIGRAQDTDKKITNMQLQKVMYFVFIEAKHESLIPEHELRKWYDQPFKLWRYGPVADSVYEKYNVFGASSIFTPEQQEEQFNAVNTIIDRLLDDRTMDLVSHSLKHSFYEDNAHHVTKKGRSDVNYTFDDLVKSD